METIPHSYSYPPVRPYRRRNAPGSIGALVFGIVSLSTMAFCGWIFAIVALNLAKKAKAAIERKPAFFSLGSERMANAGHIMGIIGLIFGLLGILVWALYIGLIVFLVSRGH
jgi:hypothetical protein